MDFQAVHGLECLGICVCVCVCVLWRRMDFRAVDACAHGCPWTLAWLRGACVVRACCRALALVACVHVWMCLFRGPVFGSSRLSTALRQCGQGHASACARALPSPPLPRGACRADLRRGAGVRLHRRGAKGGLEGRREVLVALSTVCRPVVCLRFVVGRRWVRLLRRPSLAVVGEVDSVAFESAARVVAAGRGVDSPAVPLVWVWLSSFLD